LVRPVTTLFLSHPIEIYNCFALALKTLATEKKLVHRDISYNNILLQEPQDGDDKHEGYRCGLLIDLEYAASLVTAQTTSPGRRTVSAKLTHIILQFLFSAREQFLLWPLNFSWKGMM
jgi:serine/threonine protein kinase